MTRLNVVLVAEEPGRIGGPAAWARGLVEALDRGGVDATLTFAGERSSLAHVQDRAGPDTVVHTYSQSPSSLWLARTARRLGSPIVHTVHGDFFAEQGSKRGLKRLLWVPFNRRAVALADAVTVPSAYLARSLAEGGAPLGVEPVVIPNGVDSATLAGQAPMSRDELGVPDDAALVVAVTTFTHAAKAEGVVPLCEAVRALRARGRNVELRVAGGGALASSVRSACEQDGVRFVGRVPDGARLIAAADVFVHSSGLDVFAYVVLEAFAVGTPAVVTPVGGVPELVGDAALTVPLGDDVALADALATLVDRPELRAEYAERGRARARDFDWASLVADRWAPFYREVLDRARPRAPA